MQTLGLGMFSFAITSAISIAWTYGQTQYIARLWSANQSVLLCGLTRSYFRDTSPKAKGHCWDGVMVSDGSSQARWAALSSIAPLKHIETISYSRTVLILSEPTHGGKRNIATMRRLGSHRRIPSPSHSSKASSSIVTVSAKAFLPSWSAFSANFSASG